MYQSRPWLSLAALLALAGCCMSPPSPVDGVPYGGWGEGATSPDRGPPPEPVSVPADAPSEPSIPRPKNPTATEVKKSPEDSLSVPSSAPSAKVVPVKPAIAADPLRQPLRLPMPAIDRSPALALDKGASLGGVDSSPQRLGAVPGPAIASGTGLAPSLGDVGGQSSAVKSSSTGLNPTLGSPGTPEKNTPIRLGQLASLSSPASDGNNVQLGGVSTTGVAAAREGQSPTLSVPATASASSGSARALPVTVPAGNSASSSDTNAPLRLDTGHGAQVRDTAQGQTVAIQIAPGEVSRAGSTVASPSLSVATASLSSGSATSGSVGISVSTAQVRTPASGNSAPSLVVPGARTLPESTSSRATSLSEPSAPQARESASSAKVDIHSPREPSGYLKETLNPPAAKAITPPRTPEIKIADSLAVKTGTPVVRSPQTVPTPVAVKEPVGQPLVKDRSAPITAGGVVRAAAPTDEEVAKREEERRRREEEVRRNESSLRQWLHDHLPLFF